MADSTQVRSALNVFIQRKSAERVKSTLFNRMPLLDYLFALNGQKKDADGLGRPTAGILAIGKIAEAGRPQLLNLAAAREYLPIIDTVTPSTGDVKVMGDYDSKPTVPNWDTVNAPMKAFKQPRFKFARYSMPYKVPHSEVRTAKISATTEGQAAEAVGSVYDVAVKKRLATLCSRLNTELFDIAATGVPADEDVVSWSRFHSIPAALSATNTYGGVDRSVTANAFWRGNTDTTTFSGSFEDMIENINYDKGLIALGLSVGLICVGKSLMKKAKAEARSAGYQLISPSVKDPEFGFTRDSVCVNSGSRRVFIFYDPQMDVLDASLTTKAAIALDPTTWSIAFGPGKNFRVSPASDQTLVEGGDEADTGTIDTELMIACEVPKGNVIFTDVTP